MTGVVIAELTSSRRTSHSGLAAVGVALAATSFMSTSSHGLAALLTLGELCALYGAGVIALWLVCDMPCRPRREPPK